MRCNDSLLKQLLSSDESSSAHQAVSNHLESCKRCQHRLIELSGERELLSEVRATLLILRETESFQPCAGSSVFISVGTSAAEDYGAECEPVSLDFLSPGSHPEMLGRIGRYDVERMIGSGGMGIVLKGFDTELHRVVAVKVLKPHLAHNGAARHRFAREAQSAAAVVHEHVIPIYDVQSDGEMPFLVMQYVPGQSLQSRVDERGPLDAKEILRIARQIAAGLAAAHAQGLVHRDVKPANILMEDTVERILISDFGLARTVDDATLTRTGIVAGTPHYMSPEQASGHPVDHRSDLFSLGSVIYFMCTGRPPFRAEHAMAILNRICHDTHRPVDEINREIPAELAEVVDRLLAKEPRQRFSNAHEVERHLESILARLQTGRSSFRLRWLRNWQRWKPSVRKITVNLTVIVACVVAGIGVSRWSLPTNPETADSNNSLAETATVPDEVDRRFSLQQPEIQVRHPVDTTPRMKEGVSAVDVANNAPPPVFPPDNFLNEVGEVQALIEGLEHRWNQSRMPETSQDPFDDEWYRDLRRAQAEILEMPQGRLPQTPSPKLDQPVPVERIVP